VKVLYPGGFDLLHAGHINALTLARKIAGSDGRLIVAVNTDSFMSEYKRVPARTQQERVNDVIATGLADEVILWHGPEKQDEQIIHNSPDVYVASFDWVDRDLASQLRIPSLSWMDNQGISLLYIHRTPGISTTLLINKQVEQSGT
jgi:glycerol-3-phosphate cytidylyltransferase